MIRSCMPTKQYSFANDTAVHEAIPDEVMVETDHRVIEALWNAREDRFHLIHGLAAAIRSMSDEARHELYEELGVHPW